MSRPSQPPPDSQPAANSEPAKPTPARNDYTVLQLWAVAGIVAALVIAVLGNMLAARHYTRWDWTEEGLFTLSPVTKRTLSALTEPLDVVVVLPDKEPLTVTLRHLLQAYGGETTNLKTRFVDPDQNPAAFLALQKKYELTEGKSEEGRTLSDAAVIVARGERRYIITGGDLFVVDPGQEDRARTRVEEVLTGAIRRVESGEAPRVCFTSGHGEPEFDSGGAEGLLALRGKLRKLNYNVEPLPAQRALSGVDPLPDCKLLVIAAPSQPLDDGDIARFRNYIEKGGNALIFVGPTPAEGGGYLNLRAARLLALAGVKKNEDFVFERDPARRSSRGHGETFSTDVQPHPITAGFIDAKGAIEVVLTVSSSLEVLDDAAVKPSALLTTSRRGFGMRDFFAWAQDPVEPEPQQGDNLGPLTLAFAAELPKRRASDEHGPRVVIMGSTSAIYGANWQHPELLGAGMFVESAISWLTAEPYEANVANKASRGGAVRVSESVLQSTLRNAVVILPLVTLLFGAAVFFRRRASERPSRDDPGPQRDKGKRRAKDTDPDEDKAA